jgi:DNA-directed RNA polymerase subunit RPC12/RpoP
MEDLAVIACRSALEPLTPGNQTGYKCAYCGHPLQIGTTALEAVEKFGDDAKLVCNPCGRRFTMLAAQMGKLAGVIAGPNAQEYMNSERSKGDPFADWVREQIKRNDGKA